MNLTKYQNTMILSLLAIGLLVNISQAQGNRYGFNEKETADSTNLENSRQIIAPNKTAQPQGEFWQRFRADLKTTGQQLGKAFNRAREELSYSYRTSTTKFPKNNNLNRHQKRFNGHVRTRNEARSTPYRKPLTNQQHKLPASSVPLSGPGLKKGRTTTLPPHPPLEIVRPQQQQLQKPLNNRPPETQKAPVSSSPGKQEPKIKPPVKKEELPPANSTPPPPKKNSDTSASTKLTVTENNNKTDRNTTPTKTENKPAYPFATKTEKPGYVKSPYSPFALLDVRGIKPGGLAMEPDSDRIFRVPE